MKYICIRECFVNDRLWQRDVVYELPEDMQDCRHFQLIEDAPVVKEAETNPETESTPEPEPTPEKVKPEVIPAGLYWCTKCKTLHRATSKVGVKHMKYQE